MVNADERRLTVSLVSTPCQKHLHGYGVAMATAGIIAAISYDMKRGTQGVN